MKFTMKAKLLRKFFAGIASLVLLLIFAFLLSRAVPGDPVQRVMMADLPKMKADVTMQRKHYASLYRQMGLDLPVFYISISSLALPDSFQRVPDKRFREFLLAISYWCGNPQLSYEWCSEIYNSPLQYHIPMIVNSVKTRSAAEVDTLIKRELLSGSQYGRITNEWNILKRSHEFSSWKKWVPIVHFSLHNQFHYWLFGNHEPDSLLKNTGILNGDLGRSWVRGIDVISAIKFPFLLTVIIAILVLLICLPFSLLFSGWLTLYSESWISNKLISFMVFLYAVPSFWVGTMLLIFLSNPHYLSIFPSASPVLISNQGIYGWIISLTSQWYYFIIPVVAIGYSTLVYLIQMTYEQLKEELQKPYVVTLRAKGCSESSIIFRSAMKNALVPVIVATLSVFPMLMSGTIIIDFLFSLPGLGTLISQACEQKDFPVICGILLMTGVVTIISFFVTEVLTLYVDPRMRTV